jgi:hypothetical protein
MKKLVFLSMLAVISYTASAQKDTTKVVDNKGTIKWVISNTTAVITKGDSTLLYVTPQQLGDSSFVKSANNGLTKNGQTVELGGTLNRITTIETNASNFLQITGLQRGSNTNDSVMVVNPSTGQLKFISASGLFNALTFSNGLTKNGNAVELGGDLTKSTSIGTNGTNTLKITGLESGSLATDSIVVSGSDGTLKRVTAETLLQSGDEYFTTTSPGQSIFSMTGSPASVSKVSVYRNGVRLMPTLDYTTSAGQVTLTSGLAGLVVVGDVIEVQWVK